jgi:hypothetical protein
MKPYLVFMAGAGSIIELRELVEPIKPYIRGICALVHDADEFDEGFTYLVKTNMELGAGNILLGTYVGDHSHSRNRILKETGLKQGDKLVSLDLMERVPVEFAETFNFWFAQMEEKSIDIANFYAKPYLIRYREDMIYIGTPHESLVCFNVLGRDLNRTELNRISGDENKVRINMRPLKRDKFHHINHYASYLLQPNSNQNMLGLEHRGGATSLPKYEKHRQDLITLLDACEYPRTVEGLKELLNTKTFCDTLRDIINQNGWINNFYRYHTLGERDLVDSHDWSNLPQF